jgi:hypothetical protein
MGLTYNLRKAANTQHHESRAVVPTAPGVNGPSDVVTALDGPCIYAHGRIYYSIWWADYAFERFMRYSPSAGRFDGWGRWPSLASLRGGGGGGTNRMFASRYADNGGAVLRHVYYGVSNAAPVYRKQELEV